MAGLALSAGVTQAQNHKIEDALSDMKYEVYEDAMIHIEEAAQNESTKNDRKMWYVRGKVFLKIAQLQTDGALAKTLDTAAGKKSLESYVNAIITDKAEKRRRYQEADEEMLQAVPYCYNYASTLYSKGLKAMDQGDEAGGKKMINEAIESWEIILKAYPYDENRQISTSLNLPEINVFQLIADASIKIGDKARAYTLLDKVMNAERPAAYAFVKSAVLRMEDGDTAKALEVIEAGKVRFPEEKDLTTLQLIIYQNQGKEDLLTDKITEALENDPENPNLLYNRGNLYDNRARNAVDELKKVIEKNYDLSSSIRKERDAKKKAGLEKELKDGKEKADALKAKAKLMDSLAIADYKKAYEVQDDNFDVIYNLGAIYFNAAVPLVEEANNLPSREYDQKIGALKAEWTKLYEESLKWFLLAEELKPDNQNVLIGLQQVYAQLGNQEKSMEYRDKRK